MLGDELRMLRYVARVEVGDPKVEQDVEDLGEAEECIVEAIGLVAHGVLHAHLDAKNPEWLDDEVGQQQPEESGEKFLLHYFLGVFGINKALGVI